MTANLSSIPVREIESIRSNHIPDWVFTSNQPLVLRGLVSEWPSVKLANRSSTQFIEKLQSLYSGQESLVYFGENINERRLAYNNDMSGLNFRIQRTNLSQMLDELLSDLDTTEQSLSVRYIASNIVDFYFPGFRAENDLNFDVQHFHQQALQAHDPSVGIWIGNELTSPCHFDAQNNIACCVAGQRQFTLFPPSQVENLYPGPLHLTPGGQAITMLDLEQPDLERFPKYKQAMKHKHQVSLQAGDAIFIPVMWWHEVKSLSRFNVLVNYWWNTFPEMHGQGMTALEHALLSLRHRPDEEKAAWKSLFDYYIFGDTAKATRHLPEHMHDVLGPLDDTQMRRLRASLLKKLNR